MKNWTNQKLFSECRRRGQAALEAKRLFIALLPEVARRELWKEKGFSSIYHFAAKLGGITFAQVEEVVRLEKNCKTNLLCIKPCFPEKFQHQNWLG